MHGDVGSVEDAPNHPLAIRMALVAALTFNICVGSVFGTPGVFLGPMQQRLGVTTEMASGGLLGVILVSAIVAPQVGALASRVPLKRLVAAAAVMLSLAWLLLALSTSYPLYLAAYALLLGPVIAIGASVVPPTLVTRWYTRNRGLAIGLVHLPIVVAALPLACQWLIERMGLEATLIALAVLPLVTLLPASFLIRDWPPRQGAATSDASPGGVGEGLTVGGLLKRPRYWALSLAVGVPNTGSTLLGLHLVSMAKTWGIAPLAAAGLASIMAAVGLVGSVIAGIVADRIGGAATLVLIAVGGGLLWLSLLLGLPYAGLAVIIGLLGMLGSGTVPAYSKAVADAFGQASFSRAVGLMVPVTLPLIVVGLIGPGAAVRPTGDYTIVIVVTAAAFAVAAALALFAAAPRGLSRG